MFIGVMLCTLCAYMITWSQPVTNCEPCSNAPGTVSNYVYTDNTTGCSFRIEYERWSNPCNNGKYDLKINYIQFLTPCPPPFSLEKITALGIVLLLQENIPGFPTPTNGGETRVRVISPSCWYLEGFVTTGLHRIQPCADAPNCCKEYLYRHSIDCNDVTIKYMESPSAPYNCNPLTPCVYNCDDFWKIYFGK